MSQLLSNSDGFDQPDFHKFTGSSEAMQDVYRLIEQAASSSATIFITGESGTGKELCADAIHHLSARSDGPLVAINSSAIPRELMESEIFGHVRGAFTGAVSDHDGAAIQADGGTLFLDEICEMDLDLQAKLLRFVQTGTVTKVGGSRSQKVDVRIVCATNRNPLEEVHAGRFREDLYYRLHVVPVFLPPLRQRGEDIMDIARMFLRNMSKAENKHFTGFSSEVRSLMLNYSWPGNVRELENVIHNIIVMNHGGEVSGRMLPLALARSQRDNGAAPNAAVKALAQMIRPDRQRKVNRLPQPVIAAPERSYDEIRPLWMEEQDIIERAIAICDGNIIMAAARLGISPSTIYRKRQAWQNIKIG